MPFTLPETNIFAENGGLEDFLVSLLGRFGLFSPSELLVSVRVFELCQFRTVKESWIVGLFFLKETISKQPPNRTPKIRVEESGFMHHKKLAYLKELK